MANCEDPKCSSFMCMDVGVEGQSLPCTETPTGQMLGPQCRFVSFLSVLWSYGDLLVYIGYERATMTEI
jgi:hypothetical protein